MARTRAIVIGALALLLLVVSFTSGAMIGETWRASDVVPVVLVKPGIAGFEPVEGTSIGNTWSKSEVKPVVLLKPGISGYAPREGFSMDVWTKQNVLPVVLVEPSGGGFAPMSELSSDSSTPLPTVPPASSSLPTTMESEVDGDFEGWSGETIVKLTDGHIWQQTEYYYEYFYAYMPKVLVFKSDGGYKMKVEGVEEAVGVTLLK